MDTEDKLLWCVVLMVVFGILIMGYSFGVGNEVGNEVMLDLVENLLDVALED